MVKSRIKIGSYIMLFMGMYTLVISILWIFLTEIMFVSDFAWYTGMNYQEYFATSQRFAEMYIITKKLIGIMLLVISILILLINKKSYQSGENWSWFALLIAGGVAWGTFIGYKIYIGYIGTSMITFVIGIALTIIGLAIPARDILGQKSN